MPISKSRKSPFDAGNERGGDRLLQIEAVYDKVPVGLCYINRHGLIVTINDQLSRMLGIASEMALVSASKTLYLTMRLFCARDWKRLSLDLPFPINRSNIAKIHSWFLRHQ